MTQTAIPCWVMRGGTSKGLYFLAADLPSDTATRDAVLLAAMGSPDARQIDGMGGAHPLTSKVAVIGPATRPDVDLDYLFLQVVVDEARVDAGQNCGNILAGVGPYAIEKGLVAARNGVTDVRIHMVNSASVAIASVQTPGGVVRYDGEARIDGVPGTAAPIPTDFEGVAGSSCGALLPTGRAKDVVEGVEVTCIDNGMPVVVLRAADFGVLGDETPEELEANTELKARVEAIRLAVGPLMNLGDVSKKTVPKMTLVSPARHGGLIGTLMAIAWVSWRGGLNFVRTADYLATCVPFGLLFGRLANFVNGELWGRVAGEGVRWAMVFPDAGPLPRHPSQLYEAALEGLVLMAVLLLLFWKTRARWRPGLLVGTFTLGYGLSRFTVEYFREPDSQLAEFAARAGLSMGQWLTVPMTAVGLYFIARALLRPPLGSGVPAPA